MSAIIIDGKATAKKHKDEILYEVGKLKEHGIIPCLAVVLVGDNPASVSYVRGKKKALADTGMLGRDIHLPETTPEAELLSLIASLNADKNVHGILVQFPLPAHISEDAVINAIDPRKDVDCFHPSSLGKLLRGQKCFHPCTPQGVVVLLTEYNIPVSGRHVVIVGRSNIVGKPLAMLLSRRDNNATVTICHTGTPDLALFTRQADILVAAAGRSGLIKGAMIKPEAAVIDVGVNAAPALTSDVPGGVGAAGIAPNAGAVSDGNGIKKAAARKLVGDVVFDEAIEVAGWLTPVPGGVGPMTITMLMHNVLQAAKEQVLG